MPLRNDDGPLQERWSRVAPGEPLAAASLLTLEDAAERGGDAEALGLSVENDVDIEALEPWFDRVALISVSFPSFSDGRGFSIARSLRERGYAGRLRAEGPVIADQYDYLRACGFDEVETPEKVANRQPEAQWAEVSGQITLAYQRGYSGRRNILDARRAAGDAARRRT